MRDYVVAILVVLACVLIAFLVRRSQWRMMGSDSRYRRWTGLWDNWLRRRR